MAKNEKVGEHGLLSCPFCGKYPKVTKHFKEDMWNLLHRCEIIGPIKIEWRDKIGSLVSIWNTRNG